MRFGDELTHAQCAEIVRRLAACRMPFQCAHGRPTMRHLSDLRALRAEAPLAPPLSPERLAELGL